MFNSIDLSNLGDAELRDLFDNIDFSSKDNNSINNNHKHDREYTCCPQCNSSNIMKDVSQGILVCTNTTCGIVIDSILDNNPEWRHYDDDNKDSGRCSMPINQLLPISSVGTTISGNFRNKLKVLQLWSGAMPYRERSLNNVFKKIHEKCIEGKIIKCIEDDAKIMYKNISECKHYKGKGKDKFIIIRGKNRESLIAACVFFACRKNIKTRTPKEIADLFNLKYTEITKGCKNFLKLMKIKNIELINNSSHPEQFVPRFCNKLQLNKLYTDQAIQIATNIRKLNIASVHTPFSTATCSILLMADINDLRTINKKKLASIFGVSEVTISKTYIKIEKFRKALIDDKLTDKMVKILAENKINVKIPDFILERQKKFNIIPSITKQEIILSMPQEIKANCITDSDNSYDNIYDDLQLDEFTDDEDYEDYEDYASNLESCDYIRLVIDGNDVAEQIKQIETIINANKTVSIT